MPALRVLAPALLSFLVGHAWAIRGTRRLAGALGLAWPHAPAAGVRPLEGAFGAAAVVAGGFLILAGVRGLRRRPEARRLARTAALALLALAALEVVVLRAPSARLLALVAWPAGLALALWPRPADGPGGRGTSRG